MHQAKHTGLKILVVEDDRDSAASLTTLLGLYGHEVRTASDGETGLIAAEVFAPDVVLLDIGLPGMDGFEVATRLKERMTRKAPLVVAITGFAGDEEDFRRGAASGIDVHWLKPVQPEHLYQMLARFQRVVAD